MASLHGEGTTGSSGGTPPGDYGVWGDSNEGDGVVGTSSDGSGVRGLSNLEGVSGLGETGVHGRGLTGVYGTVEPQWGGGPFNSYGVHGSNETSPPENTEWPPNAGVAGVCTHQAGVYGYTFGTNDTTKPNDPNIAGVVGISEHSFGVRGESGSVLDLPPIGGRKGEGGGGNFPQCGVQGSSDNGQGVRGDSAHRVGVHGRSITGTAVLATNLMPVQTEAPQVEVGLASQTVGVDATTPRELSAPIWERNQWAGKFTGDVKVDGDMWVTGIIWGTPIFLLSDPQDPADKTLAHSAVGSSDMKNIYDGVARLDEDGEAVVKLPEWVEVQNDDFRYQLTPIGAPGPNLYIAEKISNSRFKIAGGNKGMEVSWQIAGIRKDKWAEANRLSVEEEKAPDR